MKLTEKQFDIIGHSLGINVYHARISKKNNDKKLPKEYYRNFYSASEGHHSWSELILLHNEGFMSKREQFNEPVFHVTEQGKQAFKEKWETEINCKSWKH